MSCSKNDSWLIAIEEEVKSLQDIDIWHLVDHLDNFKPIDCKLVYKTKKDYKGNIKLSKARLVAKGFSQHKGMTFIRLFTSF